jgi:hypothetical protein
MLSVLPLVAMLGACAYSTDHAMGHSHIHDDINDHHWHLVWATAECKVDWTADGQVWYTDDARDIAKLSSGGMLTVVETYGSHTRRVDLEEKDGRLDRTYAVDGMTKSWDTNAADWFAEILLQVDHTTGALADVRFPRLMSSGGPSAVIADLADASAGAMRAYMKRLTGATTLDAGQACQVAALAQHMNSDYDRATVLIDAAGGIDFTAPSCRATYFQAVGSIGSDYERMRVLIAALDHGPTSGPSVDGFAIATIAAARPMGSDYEKAHVLVTVAPRCSTADTVRTAYLSTAQTIGSDMERARVLTALVRQQ